MKIRERLEEAYPDILFLFADRFDEAIIGVDTDPFSLNEARLVYSVRKTLALLKASMGPAPEPEDGEEPEDEDAMVREFFDVNVAGAYVGKQTPIWCEDEFLDER